MADKSDNWQYVGVYWVATISREHGWQDYDHYPTKAEAERVAKSLRKQGNRTKVLYRVTPFVPEEDGGMARA